MGTRLREETEYRPKPMVTVGGKPILWHVMKHCANHGIERRTGWQLLDLEFLTAR